MCCCVLGVSVSHHVGRSLGSTLAGGDLYLSGHRFHVAQGIVGTCGYILNRNSLDAHVEGLERQGSV